MRLPMKKSKNPLARTSDPKAKFVGGLFQFIIFSFQRPDLRDSTAEQSTAPGLLHRTNSGPNVAQAFSPSLNPHLHDRLPGTDVHPYPPTGERLNLRLPPSLWMSPASTSVLSPSVSGLNDHPSTTLPESKLSDRSPYEQSPVSPKSPSLASKSNLFTDIFSEELFASTGSPLSPQTTSPFTSPRIVGSPMLQTKEVEPDPGRRIDKGKARVRVVGFDGTNQDGFDEPECVFHPSFSPFGHPLASPQRRAHGLAGIE
ncbi:hypothetical protein C0992_012411 [Termitomyces sp. T32_za158]|nr:hypothetical protein C0992_012411 [Termitomyces sp. T32_za158]